MEDCWSKLGISSEEDSRLKALVLASHIMGELDKIEEMKLLALLILLFVYFYF